jgi:mercuric reductase
MTPAGDVDYDLLVLGAGSAAFAAAIRGRDAGYRVALAETGTLGGTCVNVGCVPSKALLAAGAAYWAAGRMSAVSAGPPRTCCTARTGRRSPAR